MCALLRSAARVEHAHLGSAYATTRLIGADTIRKIIVGRAERVRTIVAHPGATRASRYLKANAAIGIRGVNYLARIGGKKGDGGKEEFEKHVYE